MKKIIKKIFITLLLIPTFVYAYSSKIIVGGQSVGIRINSTGIIVSGSYEIDGHNVLKESGLKSGDIITKVNDVAVTKVEDLVTIINNCNCDSLKINYISNSKTKNTTINLYEDDGVLKTGLYIKDSISGVGTLTYIDPNTKLFGVLGHEITDASTGEIIKINNGTIFNSSITSIDSSIEGNPGSKNAILYSDQVTGNIFENTNKGIFGTYTADILNKDLYKVANIDDIKLGKAIIRTVIQDDKVEEFDINILKVQETSNKLKNIQFEITDQELLNKTNGIVQGMSGSPIIQGDYIIGAVTHVIVENPHKGYGILITNMLEEGEN